MTINLWRKLDNPAAVFFQDIGGEETGYSHRWYWVGRLPYAMQLHLEAMGVEHLQPGETGTFQVVFVQSTGMKGS